MCWRSPRPGPGRRGGDGGGACRRGELSSLTGVVLARSPAGLQRAQCSVGLYYKPVKNSVLDGLLQGLIYPGLLADLGYKAQPRLHPAEPLLLRRSGKICPSASLLVPGEGAGGVRRCAAWLGWGPHGGIRLLVHPKPWPGHAAPPPRGSPCLRWSASSALWLSLGSCLPPSPSGS